MIDAALLLPKIMARAGHNADLSEIAAKIAWRRIVGEGLRDNAVTSQLQEKTLFVSVADAVWQKQLQMMSAELIFRLNKLLRQNVVEKIEFRIDPGALRRGTERSPARGVSEPIPPAVISSAAAIQDSELREKFIRAAGNCIERRDRRKSAIRISQSEI